MNFKALAGNAVVAFAAQGVSLLVSLIMSLLVPKVLGVATYGYWQLFIFYVSYSGFFHFGLDDGVYLLEGGKTREEIDKRLVNSQFRVGVFTQLVVGLVVALLVLITAPEQERTFVLFAFALYTMMLNLSAYFGYVFQAMNETKLFSFMTMLERAVFLGFLVILVVFRIDSFQPFVVAYLIARACALLFSCWHARDFLRAGALPVAESLRVSFSCMKVGFGLMLANIADMLILGIGRFLVDNAWGIEVFGKVSFALSLVNFVITFVAQGSMVLFPALRQGTEEEQKSFYGAIRDAMEVTFPAIYVLYFPLVAVLTWWLPQYAESMVFFAYLLPVCVFNTKMDVCCTTYFKVLRMERVLLAVNVVTVLASFIFALLGVYVFGSLEVVLLGAVLSIACRSLWSEHMLNNHLSVQGTPMAYEELVLTVLFMLCALLLGGWLGCLAYTVCYVAYLVLNKQDAMRIVGMFSRLLPNGKAKA